MRSSKQDEIDLIDQHILYLRLERESGCLTLDGEKAYKQIEQMLSEYKELKLRRMGEQLGNLTNLLSDDLKERIDLDNFSDDIDMALQRLHTYLVRSLDADKKRDINKIIRILDLIKACVTVIQNKKDNEPVESDKINPDHYKTHEMECIDEMFALYGAQVVLDYCVCCVHKYRYRAGNKVGEDAETDLKKSDWYAKLAQNIRDDYDLLF